MKKVIHMLISFCSLSKNCIFKETGPYNLSRYPTQGLDITVVYNKALGTSSFSIKKVQKHEIVVFGSNALQVF